MIDTYSHLQTKILSFLPLFISGLLSLIPFVVLWLLCNSIFQTITAKNKDISKTYALSFIASTINYIIIAIAILTMIGTWGLDVRALLAGLGLTGFAVGFALKDVLANSLAGIMIIFYRPLAINSKVAVMGVEGRVVNIDLRYTTIESDQLKHLIPNSKLLSEKITIMKGLDQNRESEESITTSSDENYVSAQNSNDSNDSDD
ncbi:MAG: mechanosensitive ion channel [Rickettsiales bacterium]|nr:MAG: mechanosensitive ion channel [Rickettsiales bacterium]